MEVPRLEPVLRIEGHYDCRLSKKSQFENCTNFIKQTLGLEDLRWFRSTQFGNLLDVPANFQHSGQLLWSLMLRMAITNVDNELWMVINGVPERYSLKEYALLTGLYCSDEYPVVEEPDQMEDENDGNEQRAVQAFVRRHWPNKTSISTADVMRRMQENIDPLEKRKMAVLLFVIDILMGNDKLSLIIKPLYLTLVDNIEAFCTYPWGRESFAYSVKQLRKDIRSKVNSIKATFTIKGFIFPFETFAYECIPAVAKRFATAIRTEACIPQMCCWKTIKWTGTTSPSRTEISKLIEGSLDIRNMLFATNEEMMTPWMVNFRPLASTIYDPFIEKLVELLEQGVHVVFGNNHRKNISSQHRQEPAGSAYQREHTPPLFEHDFCYTTFGDQQNAPSTSQHHEYGPFGQGWLENELKAIKEEQQSIRKDQASMREEIAYGFGELKQLIVDQFKHWTENMSSMGHHEHHSHEGNNERFTTPQPSTSPPHPPATNETDMVVYMEEEPTPISIERPKRI